MKILFTILSFGLLVQVALGQCDTIYFANNTAEIRPEFRPQYLDGNLESKYSREIGKTLAESCEKQDKKHRVNYEISATLTINTEGEVVDAELHHFDFDASCEAQVLTWLNDLENWSPAYKDDEPVCAKLAMRLIRQEIK